MMDETRCGLTADMDAELERIISELAASQRKGRADTRRCLRRQITAWLAGQGFSVGDIFPAAGNGRSSRPTMKANG
jgi:hypothetical protein